MTLVLFGQTLTLSEGSQLNPAIITAGASQGGPLWVLGDGATTSGGFRMGRIVLDIMLDTPAVLPATVSGSVSCTTSVGTFTNGAVPITITRVDGPRGPVEGSFPQADLWSGPGRITLSGSFRATR